MHPRLCILTKLGLPGKYSDLNDQYWAMQMWGKWTAKSRWAEVTEKNLHAAEVNAWMRAKMQAHPGWKPPQPMLWCDVDALSKRPTTYLLAADSHPNAAPKTPNSVQGGFHQLFAQKQSKDKRQKERKRRGY